MKRLAAFFLILLMISLLCACSKEELVPTDEVADYFKK